MKKQKNQGALTDNKKANIAFLSIAAISLVILYYSDLLESLSPRLAAKIRSGDGLELLLIGAATYAAASVWFSPDLDIRTHRPGKWSFPFGHLFKLLKAMRGSGLSFVANPILTILQPVHVLLNAFWQVYWQPFAGLFTHRGAVHWPIYGTALKASYMAISYFLVAKLLLILGIAQPPLSDLGLAAFFSKLWAILLESSEWQVVAMAWIVSDICHSLVDLMDSLKKGSRFVPPEGIAPRGLFVQLLKSIRK